MNKNKNMNKNMKLLTDVLDQLEVKYKIGEDKKHVKIGFRMENLRFDAIVILYEKLDIIRIITPLLLEVPEGNRANILEFVNERNIQTLFGGFSLQEFHGKEFIEFGHAISLTKNDEGPKIFVNEISSIFKYMGFEVFHLFEEYEKTQKAIKG
ncbi:YbjN domain-containing protein [Bacillus cereus group sp. MYBK132-2]|uniref:YbjN domain-containing protein n=1 Tax=unclassified Bacillus cereus group TaxID=2750818 RepID=UPI002A280CB7|nr:YbjN domain-containing protein [Bacillus cereus]